MPKYLMMSNIFHIQIWSFRFEIERRIEDEKNRIPNPYSGRCYLVLMELMYNQNKIIESTNRWTKMMVLKMCVRFRLFGAGHVSSFDFACYRVFERNSRFFQ